MPERWQLQSAVSSTGIITSAKSARLISKRTTPPYNRLRRRLSTRMQRRQMLNYRRHTMRARTSHSTINLLSIAALCLTACACASMAPNKAVSISQCSALCFEADADLPLWDGQYATCPDELGNARALYGKAVARHTACTDCFDRVRKAKVIQ